MMWNSVNYKCEMFYVLVSSISSSSYITYILIISEGMPTFFFIFD